MWEKVRIEDRDWTVWIDIDVILNKQRVKEHTPGMVWLYPKWTPKNWWKNHFCQRDLRKEAAWGSIATEDAADLVMFAQAVDLLEGELDKDMEA